MPNGTTAVLDNFGAKLKDTEEKLRRMSQGVPIDEAQSMRLEPEALTVPKVLTSDEAKQYGFDLREGWMLKLVPNGAEPKVSLITPEQWEMTDLVMDEAGAVTDYTLLAPITEGQKRQQFTKTEYEQRLASYEDALVQQQELESLFGKVYLDDFIQDIEPVMQWANEKPEEFLTNIQGLGRTQDTEALLKRLGMNDEQIGEVFYQPAKDPLREAMGNVGDKIVNVISDVAGRLGVELPKKEEDVPDLLRTISAGFADLQSVIGGASRYLGEEAIGKELTWRAQYYQKLAPEDLGTAADFFTKKVPRAIPFSLALLPMGFIGGIAGGEIAAALGLGAVGNYLLQSIGAGVISRTAEGLMEAGGTYNDALAKGMTPEQARKAANKDFIGNYGLTVLDAFEWGLAFLPIDILPPGIVNNPYLKFATKGGKLILSGLSEAGEEGFQEVMQRLALGEEVKFDAKMQEAMALGGVMGIGFDVFGSVVSQAEARLTNELPANLKTQLQTETQKLLGQGIDQTQAQGMALERVLATDQGKTFFDKFVEDVKTKAQEMVTSERGSLELPGEEPQGAGVTPLQSTPEAVQPETPLVPPAEHTAEVTGIRGDYDEATTELTRIRAEIEATEESINDNRARQYVDLIKKSGKERGEISTLTERQYKEITGRSEVSPGAKDIHGNISWEYVLDEAATDSGYQDTESFKNAILQAKKDMGRLGELRSELSSVESQLAEIEKAYPRSTRTAERIAKLPLPQQVLALHDEIATDIETMKGRVKSQLSTRLLGGMQQDLEKASGLVSRLESQGEKAKARAEELSGKLERARELARQMRQSRNTEAELKQFVTDYIKLLVPAEAQGRLLRAVKNVRTESDMEEVINQADNLIELFAQRSLRQDILKELGKAKPTRTESGILKGKYNADIQERFEAIKHNLRLDRDDARAKIAENIEAFQKGQIDQDELLSRNELLNIAGIDGMNSQELQVALDYIKELREKGITARDEARAKNKERLTNIRADVVNVLTGGKGLKEGFASVPKKAMAAVTNFWERLVNAQYSWDSLLDKVSKQDKTSKPFQSAVSQFGKEAHKATMAEAAGIKKAQADIQAGFKEVFGAKSKSDINALLNQMQNDKVEFGTFQNRSGENITLTLTKDQIIKKVMELQDPTLTRTFNEGMKWTPKMKDALVNSLTGQELAWAQWQLDYYQKYYDAVNAIFREMYGVDLPHNLFYSPISRDLEAEVAEEILLFKDLARYASVLNGSLKMREANIHPLEFNGANEVLINHVTQMEHFKAWAETIADFRAVFGSPDVQNALRQYHGEDMLKQVNGYLADFARGGIEKSKINRTLDWFRVNFTKSILGLKPSIAINQIPTTLAYMTEMPTGDFVAGTLNFWSDPIGHYRWMMENSPYIQDRYTQGFERDIRDAMNRDLHKRLTGGASFTEFSFGLMNMGDKLGVLGGWWAKYQQGIKSGLSQAEAMIEADLSSNRTQNTSAIETLSSIQRGGSWAKILTMFTNQQNKYFRIIANNARNFQYGRGSRVNAAKNIAIAWVVLPVIFQFIADGFKFRKDRQERAVLFGPLNSLLIFGDVAESVIGWAFGEPFDYQPSPILASLNEIRNAFTKGQKVWGQYKDPYTDINTEDVIAFVEYIAKAGGEILGVPTPYLIQVEKALRSGDLRQLVFSKWALEEPKPDLPTKAAKQAAELGKPIIDENAPLSNDTPDIYDMRKLNSDYNETFKKTLPEDVIKGKFDPRAVSWAEKELSQSVYETMPNQPLYKGVTPDENTGDTYVQHYRQWQARLKITSLDKLNDFDKLYPKAYLGNLTREQYALLQEYDGLDKEGKVELLKAHPELKDNPRDEWLLAHPEDNARLAVWGQAKLLSQEAYDAATKIVGKLNIPDDALGKSLPPKEIATDYFAYNIAADKFGAMSAEARLVRANNPELTNYLGLEPVDTPIPSLELTVKWRDVQDRYDAMADKDSPFYLDSIPDAKDPDYKKGREYNRQQLKDNIPEYVEDSDRIEAYNHGASGNVVDEWVEHGKLTRQFSPSSAEAKLFLVDHPQTFQWALKEEILTDDGRNWNVPVLRIDVKWKKEDAEYDSYGQWDSPAYIEDNTARARTREALLITNPAYKLDRIKRNAYSEKLTGTLFEKYLSYFQLPETGQYRQNFRLKNPDFNDWLIKVKGYTPLPTTTFKVPGKEATVVSGVGEVPVLGESALDKALADLQSRLAALS